MLKTKVLVVICVGISVGFLMGMGVSALLRAMIAGGDRGLEMTFTALVVLMAGILITYGLKFSPDSQPAEEPGSEVHSIPSQALDYGNGREDDNRAAGSGSGVTGEIRELPEVGITRE